MTDKILILDGHNTFIRNWMVVPSMNANGDPVGGIVGFIRTLKKMIREHSPTCVLVVWDGIGGSQKRRGVLSEYKEGRKPRANRTYDFESADDSRRNIDWQRAKVKLVLEVLGVRQIETSDVEADDVIAYASKWIFSDAQKVIVSTDRDFIQLVDDKTSVYSASKDVLWTPTQVMEKLGLLPENFIYMKCLTGDASDNIDGFDGFGPKTVVKLFPFLAERPVRLEEIIEHARLGASKPKYKSVIEGKDKLIMNYKLMQLSSPTMSIQTAHAARNAALTSARFNLTEFRLLLARESLPIEDKDLFEVFMQYGSRIKNPS